MCCKTGRCITPRDQCRSSFVLDEPGIFRFLALWTLIGSRIIINTLQLWLCITQFCPDEFVSDRNHHCSTNITRFLFFCKSIYINILCRKISKDLIISSFRFTGLLVCFYLNVFHLKGHRFRFILRLQVEQIQLSRELFMPDLTGGAKKSGLQVVQLCLKVSDQLILFAVFGITFLQHFLQGTDKLVLSADCIIQL